MDKDTSHLLFVCFFHVLNILQTVQTGIDWMGERDVWRETKKDSNKVEAREKPVVKFQSIKGKLLVFSSS